MEQTYSSSLLGDAWSVESKQEREMKPSLRWGEGRMAAELVFIKGLSLYLYWLCDGFNKLAQLRIRTSTALGHCSRSLLRSLGATLETVCVVQESAMYSCHVPIEPMAVGL